MTTPIDPTVDYNKYIDFVDSTTNIFVVINGRINRSCLLYTSPSPRDRQKSRMPSSA